MKKLTITGCKPVIITFLLFAFSVNTFAQKLPTVQQISLRAPANIKVDGKSTEWNNQFQAYNHATDLFYTIANDDNNLYLIMRTEKPDVIFKIINGGGITFMINKSGKKDDKNNISVTYPIYAGKDKAYINVKDKPQIKQGSAASLMHADSVMNAVNKRLENKAKYIQTIGITGLDTLTSLYNENGIKAAALFDNQMNYTYKLTIPLKYLGIAANSADKFSYHVMIRGLTPDDLGMTITSSRSSNGNVTKVIQAPPGFSMAAPSRDWFASISATSDFWGEYTLAQK